MAQLKQEDNSSGGRSPHVNSVTGTRGCNVAENGDCQAQGPRPEGHRVPWRLPQPLALSACGCLQCEWRREGGHSAYRRFYQESWLRRGKGGGEGVCRQVAR